MNAMLGALEDDPAVARRRWATAALALVVFAAVAAFVYRAGAERSRVCRGAEARLAGVWDGPTRARVADAFGRTGTPYQAAAFAGVASVLDGFAKDWTTMRTQACEATQVRGEQSADLLDLRMECLDGALASARALTSFLAEADAEVVEKAVQAAGGLPPLAACSDAAALRAAVKLPADPATRAAIEKAREKVEEGRVRGLAGKFKEARQLLDLGVASAQAAGFAPLTAEALDYRGNVKAELGDFAGSERDLHAAVVAAEVARNDGRAASAATRLFSVLAREPSRYGEAVGWARFAEAAASRMAEPEMILSRLAEHRSEAAGANGDIATAVSEGRRALVLDEKRLGPDTYQVAYDRILLGAALVEAGTAPGEAMVYFDRALPTLEKILGKGHPTVAWGYYRRGRAFALVSRFPEARADMQKALEVLGEGHGAEGRFATDVTFQLASVEKNAASPGWSARRGRRAPGS
jgi:tetratricopeptide (TPR) repeat protein